MSIEKQSLQNFADKFNLKVVEKIHQDKRKKTSYFLTNEGTSISPNLDYNGINNFLLGINFVKKQRQPLKGLFCETIPKINEEISKNTSPEKFARKCSVTGKGMNEGFCFGNGDIYFKNESDLIKHIRSIQDKESNNLSDEFLLAESYRLEEYYHTSWNEILEEEDEWYDADGKMYTNCNKCKEVTVVSDNFDFCTNCLTHL